MYCEDLLIKVKSSDDENFRKSVMEEAYFANLGLTHTLLQQFGLTSENYDDFMQLAYLALEQAVTVYNPEKGFSLLAYYRQCLRHECYQYWVKSGGLKRNVLQELGAELLIGEKYKEINERIRAVEDGFMNQLLWDTVDKELCTEDARLIKLRFYKCRTLKQLSLEFGISQEGIRRKILRLCRILKENKDVQEVAKYYHYGGYFHERNYSI